MPEEGKTPKGHELAGLRILLVEDEYFIADDLARALSGAGASIVGPCATVARAERAIDADGIDFAILDLNLHGESGVQVAEHLLRLEIPFAFATGYGSPSVPDRFRDLPRCEKPFDPEALVKLVARSIREHAAVSPMLRSRPAAIEPG